MLLLIIVALVTGRLLGVVDLTAGQDKEVRVPLLQGGGMKGWKESKSVEVFSSFMTL